VRNSTVDAIVARLADCERVVEVGIGRRTAVAGALAAAGVTVTATDIHERPVPGAVTFVRDDVTDPALDVYDGADTIYALNSPPELHRPIAAVARDVDAGFLFTTLGGDPPAVPADRETLPGETLYTAKPVGL
jgi:uncharacterized UPF0146 family protein